MGNETAAAQSRDRKTRRAILHLLKTEGPMTSAALAGRLGVTAMAVRQHLYSLESETFVRVEERPVPIGRPAKYWHLTAAANRLFPDAYAELNVALIGAMEEAFGQKGLQRVLDSRRAHQETAYAKQIDPAASLKTRLKQLARIRTQEGYMAEVQSAGNNTWLFIENHCPICAAAAVCQGFCTAELDLFRQVLGPGVSIERQEHILAGSRRCVYFVAPASRGKA